MIKLKYGEFRDPQFAAGFSKVVNARGFKDMRVMKNILRVGNLLRKQEEEIQEHYTKLVKEYAQVDEAGKFVPNNGVPNSFVIPDDKKEEFTVKVKEFNDLEFELFADKIYLHDLLTANLSPVELGAIEPLIKDLGVVES